MFVAALILAVSVTAIYFAIAELLHRFLHWVDRRRE